MDGNRNKRRERGNEGSFKIWHIVAVAASLVLYASGFVPLYRQLSQVIGALSMFPVALAGLLFGLRGGISVGVLVIFLNFYLFSLVTPQGWTEFSSSAPAHLAALLVGGVTGWLSELLQRIKTQAKELEREHKILKDQIEERHQTEEELQRLHVDLEQRVIERTAQLQSTNDELQRSEERYHLLFENNPLPLFVYDAETLRFLAVNHAASQSYGYSQDEFLTMSIVDLHPKEERGALLEYIVSNTARLRVSNVWRHKKKDGAFMFVEVASHVLRFNEHDARQFVVYDVTQREFTKLALRDREALLRSVLDNIPQSVFWKDSHSVYAGGNNVFARAAGVDSPDHIVGKTDYDFHWKESAEGFHAVDRSVIESGIADFSRIELQRMPNGEGLWFETTKVPMRDSDGRIIGILGTSQDITRRRRTEDALAYRLDLEHLISTISTNFINVRTDQIDGTIRAALGAIGAFTGVDRSSVFLLSPSSDSMQNTHEWCREGITSRIAIAKNVPTAPLKWFIGQLKSFETLYLPNLDLLPPEASAEKRALLERSVRSAIAVPLIYQGTLVGFLGFDSVKEAKTWASEDLPLLKTVGETIVNALQRKLTEGALKESEQRMRLYVQQTPLAVIEYNLEVKIVGWNPAAEKVFGYSLGEALGCHSSIIVPENMRQHVDDVWAQLMTLQEPVRSTNENITKKGDLIICEWFNTPLVNEQGQVIGVTCIAQDITERRRALEALEQSERKYRNLIENANDAIMIVRPEDECVLEANNKACELYGYPKEEFVGMSLKTISLDVPRGEEQIQRTIRDGHYKEFETTQLRKDGTAISLLINASLVDYDGKKAILSINRDITERKRAEETTRLLAHTLESASEIVTITDLEDRITFVNEAFVRTYGYQRSEAMGRHTDMLWSPNNPPGLLADILAQNRIGSWKGEILNLTKDGRQLPISLHTSQVRDERGAIIGLVGISEDITERKQVEEALRESRQRYQTLARISPVGIFRTDADGSTTYVNPQWCHISGLSATEALGDGWLAAVHPEDKEKLSTGWNESAHTQKTSLAEYRFVRPDGSIAWVYGQAVPEKNVEDQTVGYVGTITDITERKRAEEQVKASLHEKEILLKEIHHRVKNNMQIISSLLSLQSSSVTDEQFLMLLKESQNRVKSMAMIHERLYCSLDFASVNFTDYIRELVSSLVRSYSVGGNVSVTVSGEPVSLTIDKAVPCGLIINELISNALKYAFPDARKGEICVDLSAELPNRVVLHVRDNGVGIGSDIDPLTSNSLGLRLVSILINQVKGSMEMDRCNGTRFSFTIPI